MIKIDELIRLFLPKGINWDIYEIEKVESIDINNNSIFPYLWKVIFYITEKNIKPEIEWVDDLVSKWFHDPKSINDFNIRDKIGSLCLKRRKWYSESQNRSYSRDLDIQQTETSTTKDLLFFFRGYLMTEKWV